MLDILNDVLNSLPEKAEVFLLGDFNVDISQKSSSLTQTLKHFEKTNKLKQFITSPTRSTRKTSTTIDCIYSNSSTISFSGTIAFNLSDHSPCIIVRKKLHTPQFTTTFKCRKIKHFDYSFYSNRLFELDWEPIYHFADPNLAWNFFHKNVIDNLDKYYPITEFKNVKTRSPWINNELYELIKSKEEAYANAKSSNLEADWKEAHKLRNSVHQKCRNVKNSDTKTNIENNKYNPKKFWMNLNTLWGSPSPGSGQRLELY